MLSLRRVSSGAGHFGGLALFILAGTGDPRMQGDDRVAGQQAILRLLTHAHPIDDGEVDERRRAQRFALSLQARLFPLDAQLIASDYVYEATTRDISTGGISFLSIESARSTDSDYIGIEVTGSAGITVMMLGKLVRRDWQSPSYVLACEIVGAAEGGDEKDTTRFRRLL